VGVVPPSAVLDDLEAACAPLRVARDDLRWTGRELWHLTLAFLGEVGDDDLASLVPWLERAAGRQCPFTLNVAGGGAFTNPARANVLWSGLSGDRDALAALAATVAGAALEAGIRPADSRGFTPHLTLARCRAPVDVRGIIARLDGYRGPGWTVQEIHLIRSWLSRNQPRYETIETWKLRAAA
jgi:RNA 2',3'-cyclic 3'-phosphodiesterase